MAMVAALVVLWMLGEQGGRQARLSATSDFGASGGAVVAILLLVIAMNALFIMGETAVDLIRPVHVKHVKEAEPEQANRLQALLEGKAKYATACALGSRLARMVLGLLIVLLSLNFGLVPGDGLTTFDTDRFLTFLVIVAIPVVLVNLVVGELVPKSFATVHPHRSAVRLHGFIRLSAIIFSLPAAAVVGVANLVTRTFGGHASFTLPNQAEEEIKTIVESAQESGEIEVDEKEMLHSVFEFTDTVAREVMTPRVDMDAMPLRSDPHEVVRVMRESGHTRIPLYDETDDQIVGIIHAKDLLMALLETDGKVSVRSLMRPVLFVPEGKNLHELLTEMRINRVQIAIVQDEFGGTAGVVTTEDIVEELVGDIIDEYDVEEPEMVESEGAFLVDGKAHLDDISSALGTDLESEQFDTVGGYVFGLFGKQPKVGDSIEAEGLRFTVAETDGRRIQRLRIEKAAPANVDLEF